MVFGIRGILIYVGLVSIVSSLSAVHSIIVFPFHDYFFPGRLAK